MDNSAYIEDYFSSTPDPEQALGFAKRIEADPAFAEEVAFYLSVHSMAKELSDLGKKERFKEIYQNTHKLSRAPGIKSSNTPSVRNLVYYMAAAAVVAGIVFGIYTQHAASSPTKLAALYESEHLATLSVTLSAHSDSLQTGIRLYNEGKLDDALLQFEKMIQTDSSNFTAKKYAGLVCLRQKDYDKALHFFIQLETYRELYSNPAIFYQALTLMERNQAGDLAKAKLLLQQVVKNDLEGKETAVEWLKRM